jgi:adenylate kinase
LEKRGNVPKRIVVTGIPCTGKTTLAKSLAKKLGVAYVSVNGFAIRGKLFSQQKNEKEKTVRLGGLAKKLKKFLEKIGKKAGGYVVEGHLACEFPIPCDAVVVLRADPAILEKRCRKRGYSQEKTDENILSEILDYCLVKSEKNFPKGMTVNIDNSIPLKAGALVSRLRRRKSDFTNWMPLLLSRLLPASRRGSAGKLLKTNCRYKHTAFRHGALRKEKPTKAFRS